MKKTLLTTFILVLFFCTAHSAGFRDYDEETAPVGTDIFVMQQADNSATNFLTFANLATNYLATLYEPLKGPDDNFVTDAEKVVIGNTSGTNTGDETSTTIIAEFNSGSCSGYLKSDGNCDIPAGGGDVSKVGTPVNDQIVIWTGDGTAEGDADLTFDGTTLTVTGGLNVPQSATAQGTQFFEASGDGTNKHTITAQTMAADRQSYWPDYVIGFPDTAEVDSTGSIPKEFSWNIYDSDTSVAIADGKQAGVVPSSYVGKDLVDVTCSTSVITGGTSGTTTVVVRRVRGDTAVDMTSTGVTITYTDYTASDAVINTANDDIGLGDKIFIDVNAIPGGTAPTGLYCTTVFQ